VNAVSPTDVMAGHVPAIHAFGSRGGQVVDARHRAGHDGEGVRSSCGDVGGEAVSAAPTTTVMAGLVPAIHAFLGDEGQVVDARHKAGHVGEGMRRCRGTRARIGRRCVAARDPLLSQRMTEGERMTKLCEGSAG
jgi:hypothetical protein